MSLLCGLVAFGNPHVAFAQHDTPKLTHPVESILGAEYTATDPVAGIQMALLEIVDPETGQLHPGLHLTLRSADSTRASVHLTPQALHTLIEGLEYLFSRPHAPGTGQYAFTLQPDLIITRVPVASSWELDLQAGADKAPVVRTLPRSAALLLLDRLQAIHRRLPDGLDR